MLFPFSQVFECTCLAFAFSYLPGKKAGYWRYFKWFLLVTVLTEMAGFTLLSFSQPNHWLYNIYIPIEILFKSYLLYKLCSPYFRVTRWLVPGLALFGVVYLYESFNSSFSAYSFMSNSLASMGIIIICCLYFYYFLKKEEYVNIYTHAPFWIITGLFFFYFGSTACNLFFNYLASIYVKQHIPVRYITFSVLNFILYGCWSYSFVCKYRHPISSSS